MDLISDVLVVAGLGAIVTGAFFIATPAGLIVLGCTLLVLAYALMGDSEAPDADA